VIAADSQIWCVIPVKGFARGKSRLASKLGAHARAELSKQMCMRVVSLALAESRVRRTLVATDDDEVESLAREMGAETLRDEGDDTLGNIVDRALAHVMREGATHAVVLMSDLPQLQADDVGAALDALDVAAVVIAPDRARLGTNLLGLRLLDRAATCFGRGDSFAAHVAAARESDARVVVLDRPGLALDLDTPDDYANLMR